MNTESNQHLIPRLSAEETERIRRTPGRSGHPICGIVIGSSWHEPVACAYPPDHTGDHSWASIPQFDPAKEPVVGTPEPDYSGYGTRQEMRKEIVFLREQRRSLEEQLETLRAELARAKASRDEWRKTAQGRLPAQTESSPASEPRGGE